MEITPIVTHQFLDKLTHLYAGEAYGFMTIKDGGTNVCVWIYTACQINLLLLLSFVGLQGIKCVKNGTQLGTGPIRHSETVSRIETARLSCRL